MGIIHVDPPYARLFVVNPEGKLEEVPANKRYPFDESMVKARKLTLVLFVPRWGAPFPELKNRAAGDDKFGEFDGYTTLDYVPFSGTEEYPSDGTFFRAELSTFQSLSAWTKNRPTQAIGTLVLFVLSVFSLFFYRRSIRRIVQRAAGTLDEIPQVVTGYTLQSKLGEGGMGEVWSATSDSGDRVAIKFLKKELGEDPEYRKRFEREIKACIPLDHPRLLRLYGYGDATDGRMYTISELLLGKTLKETIAGADFHPPKLALDVLAQMGAALSDLHQQGLIHRDVKPDNIFCCDDGNLKLLDMGLVHGDGLTEITQTGQVLGTPAYSAPEQTMGQPTAASDQYALGIILYEILAGQRPFTQPNRNMLMYQHQAAPPPPLVEMEPRITPEVEAGVLKMLEKKPEQRFSDLQKATEELLGPLKALEWSDTESTQASQLKDFEAPG